MLESQARRATVNRKTSVHADDIRRQVATPAQRFRDRMASSKVATGVISTMLLTGVALPALYPPIALIGGGYLLWFTRLKTQLPFRVPMDWPGVDYSTPNPAKTNTASKPSDYMKADGLLHFGIDQETGTELIVTNSDARQHIQTLGTTGSGKALPLSAKILTPQGWRLNGELKAGDEVCSPDGSISRITSVHPQGKMKLCRVMFEDGRYTECTLEHLWQVRSHHADGFWQEQSLKIEGADGKKRNDAPQVMDTASLGIYTGAYPERKVTVPLISPVEGAYDPRMDEAPDEALWRELSFEVKGSVSQRRRMVTLHMEKQFVARNLITSTGRFETTCDSIEQAIALQNIIYSLGGIAMRFVKKRPKGLRKLLFKQKFCLRFYIPEFEILSKPNRPGLSILPPEGLRILSIETLEADDECSCIKVDRADGLYITQHYIVTHNTEFLLGIVAQPLMWSSGFLFVDGKGTAQFYARIWRLARRFGREDDLRVLNFMGAEDPDAPSGGPTSQTNTLNPFASGTADQLSNLLMSLMGDSGSSGDMWKSRATTLISTIIRVLVEMRNAGDLLLDVQSIRDYLPLGVGLKKQAKQPTRTGGLGQRGMGGGEAEKSPDLLSEEDLAYLRTKPGLVELYLRAMNGEFSNSSKLALKGFFDSLPGFSMTKPMAGDDQDQKPLEQYGFLSMQLTKPLGSLADDFGHIFRTPMGEVDMNDVVFQRRILIVLLPALQKAPDEVKNCGKIIVGMVKQMMGLASGDKIDGPKIQIIESNATKSSSPFIAVFDEIGYYMVDGFDVMMAQARSLGFCIMPAGQDVAAMKKGGSTVADSVIANARIFVVGALEDAKETWQIVQAKFAKTYVSGTSGYSNKTGLMGSNYQDRQEVQFQEVERVTLTELQKLKAGEFFILFEGNLAKANTLYIGEDFDTWSRVNKFLKVRGPTDRAPGVDQSHEQEFSDAWLACQSALCSKSSSTVDIHELGFASRDSFAQMLYWADRMKASNTVAGFPGLAQAIGIFAVLGQNPAYLEDWSPELGEIESVGEKADFSDDSGGPDARFNMEKSARTMFGADFNPDMQDIHDLFGNISGDNEVAREGSQNDSPSSFDSPFDISNGPAPAGYDGMRRHRDPDSMQALTERDQNKDHEAHRPDWQRSPERDRDRFDPFARAENDSEAFDPFNLLAPSRPEPSKVEPPAQLRREDPSDDSGRKTISGRQPGRFAHLQAESSPSVEMQKVSGEMKQALDEIGRTETKNMDDLKKVSFPERNILRNRVASLQAKLEAQSGKGADAKLPDQA